MKKIVSFIFIITLIFGLNGCEEMEEAAEDLNGYTRVCKVNITFSKDWHYERNAYVWDQANFSNHNNDDDATYISITDAVTGFAYYHGWIGANDSTKYITPIHEGTDVIVEAWVYDRWETEECNESDLTDL